ncbi:proline--tRNA ligase [Paenibacillus daejeonensis]|uniref:proline--tRNA ligase n=1 Tax=Paenibacillus daejeonensis TaxID=135193 RepID=UPI000364976A|nr:proline--tRNA ligase [Paenibacillus daejeonensis]
MRQSQALIPTLREAPAEAEAVSHQLLLRGGYIRQLASGVYSYLPLGLKVLQHIERIVREELEAAEAQELLMPALQPAELWQASGRYAVYGPELIRLQDRHDRSFALGPTHEEVITTLIQQEIHSYRQLPLTLYQIQTKFRDERRPRFGLLRGREFVMKDAYSFAATWEEADQAYLEMFAAYERILRRCGLAFRAVQADSGAMGGEGGTHEFMALADIGEDTIAVCTSCDYAANLEKAEARAPVVSVSNEAPLSEPEMLYTPGVRTIAELKTALGVEAQAIFKTLLYIADDQPVAVVVRGDHEVNETKVKSALGAQSLELATPEQAAELGTQLGFAGPVGLEVPILADTAVWEAREGIAGANVPDSHVAHVVPGRDFAAEQVGDFRNVQAGEACPHCEAGQLQLHRGIEVGHVFKLGTKYSEALNARYLDRQGREQPVIMGCYGIGISRLLATITEQYHDEQGIRWPGEIAPFQVHVIPVSVKDGEQLRLARELYAELRSKGFEVLLDDRDERPGVKFKDADLIGSPVRIIVGKAAGEGAVEYSDRRSPGKQLVQAAEATERVMGYYGAN